MRPGVRNRRPRGRLVVQPGRRGVGYLRSRVHRPGNQPLATVDLPVDVGVPVLLTDSVFFPGPGGSTAAVVSRQDWTTTATPEYGRALGGSQSGFDGESIYVIADGKDVLIIDPTTFEVTDTVEPLYHGAWGPDLNSLTTGFGALWTVAESPGILQRFDIE